MNKKRRFGSRKNLVRLLQRIGHSLLQKKPLSTSEIGHVHSVQLLEDKPLVLSAETYAKNMGSQSYEWKKGQSPTTEHCNIIHGKSENVVPMVALENIVDASPRCSIRDRAPTASGDRKQYIRDWLQPFTEGLVGKENLDNSAVLVKQFPQNRLHIFRREPRTNLEGNTKLQQLSETIPRGIFLDMP